MVCALNHQVLQQCSPAWAHTTHRKSLRKQELYYSMSAWGRGKKKQTQCDAYMEFKVTAVLVSLGCSKCVFQGMTDTAGTVIAWIPETSLAFWVSGCLAKCLGHDNPSGGVSQAVNKTRRDKWLHSTKQQLLFGRQTLKPYLKSQTHPLCGSRGLTTHQTRLELLHPACFILPEPVPVDCTVSFPTFTAI